MNITITEHEHGMTIENALEIVGNVLDHLDPEYTFTCSISECTPSAILIGGETGNHYVYCNLQEMTFTPAPHDEQLAPSKSILAAVKTVIEHVEN